VVLFGNISVRACAWLSVLVFALQMLPGCSSAEQRKESELSEILRLMRAEMDQFTLEHRRRPHSLKELVTAGYFKSIPADPVTGRDDWRLVWGPDGSGSTATLGIIDIHSSSNKVGRNGTRYGSW
jgi:hypothetical protein